MEFKNKEDFSKFIEKHTSKKKNQNENKVELSLLEIKEERANYNESAGLSLSK